MPEAIPALVYVVGLFFAIVGYLTARGLLATWTHSLGYVFSWLASKLPDINTHIPGVPHINLKAPFQAIDGWAVSALQAWCDGAEIEIGYCLHGLRDVALYTAKAIDWLAKETDASLDWLENVRLPKWAKWAALAAVPPALLGKLIASAVAHLRPEILRTIKTIPATLPAWVAKLARYAAPVALPSPWAFPRFRRSWRELEAWRRVTRLRLRRLEALLAASGLALAVANMTGTTFRCWRGQGNIARALRHVCGLPKWLLDFAILGIAEAFIVSDLCEFSDLLISQTKSLRPGLMAFVDVEDALVGCHDFTGPDPLTLPPLSLPPMPGPSLLAA